jgi:hypothetical protein
MAFDDYIISIWIIIIRTIYQPASQPQLASPYLLQMCLALWTLIQLEVQTIQLSLLFECLALL